ncbi:Clp protease N-terminal domain-containing protein [Streptomyces sp. NPDC056628]|uniref:Clp protease N-terminal domain-containing protein n=1 Tax=Streptomyces sp. NPDC056628 TaxID=3345882 RepID=UPI0036ACCC21
MQPRIPRQSPQEEDSRRQDAARLSDELAAVVSGARRRAVRDRDRHADTAHLLHSLLEHDPDVHVVVGDGPQVARLLGYLVQRSIGYGLRWQGTVEDSGALPAQAGDGLSPLAADAMHDCRLRAARRGDPLARGVDLLGALVRDPRARAVEVLRRAGVDVDGLRARIDEGHGEEGHGEEGYGEFAPGIEGAR